MKIVVFGLTISSTWGNGHATVWRSLARALIDRGHEFVFFERDVPYYRAHRDLEAVPGGELCLYSDWPGAAPLAERQVREADVAIVTSYCADAQEASEWVLDSRARLKVFYDLDTPVTLEKLRQNQEVPYIREGGFGDFDLVLSFTGGAALEQLRTRLGARRVAALYGSVDPQVHARREPVARYRADLSYLGTYAEDRQAALDALFLAPARRLHEMRFLVAGAQYPEAFPWTANIFFVRHLGAQEHPAFYSSSRLTLNVTRKAMAKLGYCPSGRLFEASACGTPILSDRWEGIEEFFSPGEEILLAGSADEAIEALRLDEMTLGKLATRARERTLTEHTGAARARQMESIFNSCFHPGSGRLIESARA
jgi:spore maturation protein CgeB